MRRPAAPQRPATPDNGVPLPPEPPEFSDPPDPSQEPPGPTPRIAAPPTPPQAVDDEEAMLAEAADSDWEPSSRRDPEDAALELLAEQLGARRLDP